MQKFLIIREKSWVLKSLKFFVQGAIKMFPEGLRNSAYNILLDEVLVPVLEKENQRERERE